MMKPHTDGGVFFSGKKQNHSGAVPAPANQIGNLLQARAGCQ